MNHPEVVDRLAILNAAHPRRLTEGLHHPSQLRRSWYFFFFAAPGLPETPCTPETGGSSGTSCATRAPRTRREEIDRYIEAWSQPGAAAAMINYYRAAVGSPEGSRSEASPDLSADPSHLGGARSLPRPDLAEPAARRRAQPRPRRAPARRVALGPSRRGRARQTTTDRLLRQKMSLAAEPSDGRGVMTTTYLGSGDVSRHRRDHRPGWLDNHDAAAG